MNAISRRLGRRLARPLLRRLDAKVEPISSQQTTFIRDIHTRLDAQDKLLGQISSRLDGLNHIYGGISGRLDTAELALNAELSALKVMVSRLPWLTELDPYRTKGMQSGGDIKEDIRALLASTSEIHQDIIVNKEVLASGPKDCAASLEFILPRIGSQDVVLEIGSQFGYFSRAIAQAKPEALLVSVEADRASAALQRRLLMAENSTNVILVQSDVNLDWLRQINHHSCTVFDTVLLSKAQTNFPGTDLPRILLELDGSAPQVIVGSAVNTEVGKEAREILSETRTPEVLGTVSDSAGAAKNREVVAYTLYNYERQSYHAYIGDPNTKRDASDRPGFVLTRQQNREWRFRKRGEQSPYEPGVLLWDIKQLGRIVWPPAPTLLEQFDLAMQALPADQRWDIRPWNLIYTSRGLRIIDSSHSDTPHDPGEADRVRNWLSSLDVV